MKKDRKEKKYIFVCHGKDCLKNGAKVLQKQLEKQAKSSNNGYCEILKTRCMDHCKDAPSLVVDNTWYGRVATKDLEGLLQKKAVKDR